MIMINLWTFLLCLLLMNALSESSSGSTCLHLDYSTKHGNDSDDHSSEEVFECKPGHICNKSFRLTLVDIAPYVTIFSMKDDILKKCCGDCVDIQSERYVRHLHEDKNNVDPISPNSSDLIFPVLEKSSTTSCHGYYFIPIVRLPSLMFISRLQRTPFERAVISCINLYPMLMICLLMSLIAGFIIWFIEKKDQSEEFPNDFPIGWMKGIWWSTVTLASTGLEHTPRTPLARVLSVAWVVAGVILLGLLTSSITAAMLKPIPTPSMEGALVGTHQYRSYNNYVITKNGGKVKTFPHHNISVEFFMMVRAFYFGEIDGILINRYSWNFATKYVRNHHIERNKILKFFLTHTLLTEKKNEEDMSFGMMVKDKGMYNYLKDAVKTNWLYYETMFATYVNNITVDEIKRRAYVKDSTAPLFSPSDPYVYYAMSGFGGTLIIIITFGFYYEYKRRRDSKEKKLSTVTNGGIDGYREEYRIELMDR